MAHAVHYRVFSDGERETGEVGLWADECYAAGHDWQEDPFGDFPGGIEFSSRAAFETMEDAKAWLDDKAAGSSYYSGGVRFVDLSAVPVPKKVESARRRETRLRREVEQAESRAHFADHKAALVGCRACGSKIARDRLRGNRCPACCADMRPKSVLDAIAAKRARLEEAVSARKDAERGFARSAAAKAPVKWLVRIEYHC